MENYAELLQELKKQEELIQFTEFTSETALEIGLKIYETAKKQNKALTIDICRNGQQLFHYAMQGKSADNDEWIKRKSRVANRFGHSSYYMNIFYKNLGVTMQEKSFLNPMEYSAVGGSFPILIKNVGVVGTITVSGLPQEEDHKLVVTALKEFLKIKE